MVHAHDQKGFRDLHNDACKKLHNPEILATVKQSRFMAVMEYICTEAMHIFKRLCVKKNISSVVILSLIIIANWSSMKPPLVARSFSRYGRFVW